MTEPRRTSPSPENEPGRSVQAAIVATTTYASVSRTIGSARLLRAVIDLGNVDLYSQMPRSRLSSDMQSKVRKRKAISFLPKPETLEKLKHTVIPPYSPSKEIALTPVHGVVSLPLVRKHPGFNISEDGTTIIRTKPSPVNGLTCVVCKASVEMTTSTYGRAVTSFVKKDIERLVRKQFRLVEERETVQFPVFTTGPVCQSCFDIISKETYHKDGEDRPVFVMLPWPVDGTKDIPESSAARQDNDRPRPASDIKSVDSVVLYKGEEFLFKAPIASVKPKPPKEEVDPACYRKFGLR